MYAGPGGNRGVVHRLGPGRPARPLWEIKEKFPVWSGALVDRRRRRLLRHDGRLVQGGRRARPARVLWQFKTGSGIIGQPITYKGPDGKQYVAVLSGVGGWAGAIVAGKLDPRDATGALGFVNAMSDLPQAHDEGRRCSMSSRCL